MDLTFQNVCAASVVAYSLLSWLVLTGIKLNYGRLSHSFASIYVNPKFGWFFFELPNIAWAIYFLFVLNHELSYAFALFIVHYINRDIIYPLTMKSNTRVPLEIMLSAFFFTFANGFLQAIANSEAKERSFMLKVVGTIIFVAGMWMNIYSDNILQKTKEKLVKEGSKKYVRIDQFLFKYISNPNYLGQIIEWIGYSIVSGHHYAFLFVFSIINFLISASLVRNKWNILHIPNYPKERKAILPYLL